MTEADKSIEIIGIATVPEAQPSPAEKLPPGQNSGLLTYEVSGRHAFISFDVFNDYWLLPDNDSLGRVVIDFLADFETQNPDLEIIRWRFLPANIDGRLAVGGVIVDFRNNNAPRSLDEQ